MESNQIYTTVQSTHQLHNLAGMHGGVVQSGKADVLERTTALVREVVLLQQVNHLGNRHLLLGRHQHMALFGQWRVHRYSHVALTLVEESLQLVLHTHTRYSDAARTPGIAPIGSQHLSGLQDSVEVIHGLTLTHKHDIGQCVALWQRIYLVQDISSSQTALKPLFTSLTEQAIHFTTHLARYTQRGSVAVWYIHRFNKLTTTGWEQIFDGSIHRTLTVDGRHAAHLVLFGQFFTVCLRQVGHIGNATNMLLVEPLGNLCSRKLGHSQFGYHLLQFARLHA